VFFTGKFELSIDAKQRVAIPAKIRARLERERAGNALFVIPGSNGALWVWPERTFEEIAGEVAPTLTPAREQLEYDESTFPDAEQVELDAAGRIRIPQHLLELGGLTSRVLLLGMRHHLELWNPDTWTQRCGGRPPRDEMSDRARAADRSSGHEA
jgi:MraZ protein